MRSSYYAISPLFRVEAAASLPAIDTVEPGGAKQLRLRWTLTDDGGHNIRHFELERSSDNGTTWTDAGNAPPVPDHTTTWYDSGRAVGTDYVYRVRAIAAGGYEGAWSAASTAATTLAAVDEIPVAPELPTMSPVSRNARVVWTAPTETEASNILSYNVRRCPAGCGQSFTFTAIASSGATQYDDIDFDSLPEGIYLYSVRVVNTDGEAGAG